MANLRERITSGIYVATHPIRSLRAAVRQEKVKLESSAPPAGGTWEEFPNLTIRQASNLIHHRQVGDSKQGISPIVWSKADQERMSHGEMPKSPPLHHY